MKNHFLKLFICKIAILLFLFPTSLFGQNEVQLFKSLENYKTSKYELAEHVSIERRKDKDIKMYGGSDYVISSSDRKLLSLIEKYYWFVLQNDSLFVNCKQLGLCSGYAYSEQIGNNLFIIVPANAKYNTPGEIGAIVMGGILFGAIGGAIAGVVATSIPDNAVKYIYYVLDTKNEKIRRLNKHRMSELLMFNEELVSQYLNEPDPKNANTQRKYLMEYKKEF